MGIVENYDKIKDKKIIIIGIGGVGSLCCEMLVRMGVEHLIIYDYDKVSLANMNRLFFTPIQIN